MRKALLTLASILLLAGAPLMSAQPASAAGIYFGFGDGGWHHYHHHHHRHHHAYRVCHTRYRRVIVWRRHHRVVIRVPAGERCHWVHRRDRRDHFYR